MKWKLIILGIFVLFLNSCINVEPVNVVNPQLVTPALKLVHNDPSNGETVYELTNVNTEDLVFTSVTSRRNRLDVNDRDFIVNLLERKGVVKDAKVSVISYVDENVSLADQVVSRGRNRTDDEVGQDWFIRTKEVRTPLDATKFVLKPRESVLIVVEAPVKLVETGDGWGWSVDNVVGFDDKLYREFAWWNTSFLRRVNVTIDGTNIDDNLHGFPVHVDLSTLPSEFWDNVDSAGADIRVTNSTGDLVPREVVFINTTGNTGELHFRSNLTSGTNATYSIYFDNTAASEPAEASTNGAQNVWSDNYVGVYHFQGSSDDSSPSQQDAASTDPTTQVDGIMGLTYDFATGTEIDYNDINDFVDQDFTLEAWVNADLNDYTSSTQGIVSKWTPSANEQYALRGRDSGGESHQFLIQNDTSNTLQTAGLAVNTYDETTWAHVVGVAYYAENATIYQNGSLSVNITWDLADGVVNSAADFRIGNEPNDDFNGEIDEVRVSSVGRKPEWVNATYKTIANPSTFYAVESAEFNGDDAFPVWSNNQTNNTNVSENTLFSVLWTDPIAQDGSTNLTTGVAVFAWHNGVNWTKNNDSSDQESGTQSSTASSTGGAITYVNSTEATNGATQSTTITVNRPTDVQEDDVMITMIGISEEEDAGTSPNTLGGWTFNISEDAENAASDPAVYVYYKVANASEASSYTWTNGGTTTHLVAEVVAYRNVNTTDPLSQVATLDDAGVDGCPTSPSITPDELNEMVLFIGFMDSDQLPATESDYYPNGVTGREVTGTGTTGGLGLGTGVAEELRDVNTSATGTRDWQNCAGVDEWAGITVSLRPIGDASASNETNATAVDYGDMIDAGFDHVTNFTITVNVTSYDSSASIEQGTQTPELFLQVYNGTDFEEVGNFSVTGEGNHTITVTASNIASAWGTLTQRDIKLQVRHLDWFNDTTIDQINWTGVWVNDFNTHQELKNVSSLIFNSTNCGANESLCWVNVTQTLTSTEGATIKWIVYANDTFGNRNETPVFEFTTTAPAAEGDSCDLTNSSDDEIDCGEACIVDTNHNVNFLRVVNTTGGGIVRITGFVSASDVYIHETCDVFVPDDVVGADLYVRN